MGSSSPAPAASAAPRLRRFTRLAGLLPLALGLCVAVLGGVALPALAQGGAVVPDPHKRAAEIERLQQRDAENLAAFGGCQSSTPPERRIRQVPAGPLQYPPIAQRMSQQGEVLLCVSILADGSVERMAVIRSSTWPMLDEAALAFAARSRFVPAQDGQGAAMADRIRLPVRFVLK